jgi:type IV secretion/conjugal transfer VirB4 family ATPase
MIDEERRILFEGEQHFESHYYLTFLFLPPADVHGRIESWFYEGGERHRPAGNARAVLDAFVAERARIVAALGALLTDVEPLDDAQTLTYLHATVSTRRLTVAVPATPIALDYLLTDDPLTGGLEPRLGHHFIGVLTVRDFPGETTPGMLDALNRLGFEYRWVSRYVFFDKAEGERELNKIKRRLFAGRKSIGTLIKEALFKAESVMENTDAVNRALDADAALQELSSDAVGYGYFTQSIVVVDPDMGALRQKLLAMTQLINGLGFIVVDELQNRNCLDAWLGSIPGCCGHNLRFPIVSTLNLAHLFPLSAVWAGPTENAHLSQVLSARAGVPVTAAPHFYAVTNGTTPFRLSLNVGDVGHTMIVGPTGAGKSVLLNLLEAQWMRYPGAQVYVFDKGGSSRALTAGVGGQFHDLGDETAGLAFQPLARCDLPQERCWALEWLLDILRAEGLQASPETKGALWKALTSLASTGVEERTITGLMILTENERIKAALLPYTIDGAHGQLLDSRIDTLEDSRWQVFEMEELMHRPAVVLPVLSYLFHRLEQRFAGAPTLLVLDEAWLFLDHPFFAPKIREWLKVLRKANVYVVFATQSLADVDDSAIVSTVKEACMTKIFLPNQNALDEDTAAVYQKFGLNDRQLHILAHGQYKRDYYCTSPNGNRLFELGLSEVALAYCGGTSKDNQALVRALLSDPAQDFNRAYLAHHGVAWGVAYLETLQGHGSDPRVVQVAA